MGMSFGYGTIPDEKKLTPLHRKLQYKATVIREKVQN
jgi:hypothetical protein